MMVDSALADVVSVDAALEVLLQDAWAGIERTGTKVPLHGTIVPLGDFAGTVCTGCQDDLGLAFQRELGRSPDILFVLCTRQREYRSSSGREKKSIEAIVQLHSV
jgi:hypothetical protein